MGGGGEETRKMLQTDKGEPDKYYFIRKTKIVDNTDVKRELCASTVLEEVGGDPVLNRSPVQHAVHVVNVNPLSFMLSMHSADAPVGQSLAGRHPFDQNVRVMPETNIQIEINY